jgi:knotted carbamoyltransferase YgeW
MNTDALQYTLNRLKTLQYGEMYSNDFLLTWEKSDDEIQAILETARILRGLYTHNISPRIFDSGLAVSHFRDNSTRTRFSFASAANLLGLTVQDLDEQKSQISHGETVRETAIMISFLTQAVGIRDDMFLGAGNAYMREVAAALDEGACEGTLLHRPTIVNLQCDIDHPTQTMADLAHLYEYFGDLDQLKGKKLAMTWAYSPSYGKPLSVPQGIIGLMTRFGMQVTLAYPEGYHVIPDVLDIARNNVDQSGGSFQVINSMDAAFEDADIVYPKSWAPYHVMEQRTALLQANDHAGLQELEKQCLAQNAHFKQWECTETLMAKTKQGRALYMHCLPADISGVSCQTGEVSQTVFEKYRIQTYKEAAWKPFIIAAAIMLAKVKNPVEILERLVHTPRKLREI